MKFKIIINYKSVRECYMAINPMIRKILYGFIGTSLACLLYTSDAADE